jgi:hypothetical protein
MIVTNVVTVVGSGMVVFPCDVVVGLVTGFVNDNIVVVGEMW